MSLTMRIKLSIPQELTKSVLAPNFHQAVGEPSLASRGGWGGECGEKIPQDNEGDSNYTNSQISDEEVESKAKTTVLGEQVQR